MRRHAWQTGFDKTSGEGIKLTGGGLISVSPLSFPKHFFFFYVTILPPTSTYIAFSHLLFIYLDVHMQQQMGNSCNGHGLGVL